MLVKSRRPLFQLGQTVATPGALQALTAAGQSPAEFLNRHVRGDWGKCCEDSKELNTEALTTGDRILSVYETRRETTVWIITEGTDDAGQRRVTTLLLPSEY